MPLSVSSGLVRRCWASTSFIAISSSTATAKSLNHWTGVDLLPRPASRNCSRLLGVPMTTEYQWAILLICAEICIRETELIKITETLYLIFTLLRLCFIPPDSKIRKDPRVALQTGYGRKRLVNQFMVFRVCAMQYSQGNLLDVVPPATCSAQA